MEHSALKARQLANKRRIVQTFRLEVRHKYMTTKIYTNIYLPVHRILTYCTANSKLVLVIIKLLPTDNENALTFIDNRWLMMTQLISPKV